MKSQEEKGTIFCDLLILFSRRGSESSFILPDGSIVRQDVNEKKVSAMQADLNQMLRGKHVPLGANETALLGGNAARVQQHTSSEPSFKILARPKAMKQPKQECKPHEPTLSLHER